MSAEYGAPDEAPVKSKSVCVSLLAEDGNEITKKLPCEFPHFWPCFFLTRSDFFFMLDSTTISSLKVLMKRTFGLDPTSEIDLILKTRKEVSYLCELNKKILIQNLSFTTSGRV
jgi:hypothetical protein